MKYPSSDLLQKKFVSGFDILPFVHYQIMCSLNKTQGVSLKIQRISIAKKLFRIFKSIPFFRVKRCKTLIFSSTLFNEKCGSSYQNILHGYYKKISPKEVFILEDPTPDICWRIRRTDDSGINYLLLLVSRLFAMICHKIRKRYNSDYDIFIEKHPEIFNYGLLSYYDYFFQIYSFLIKQLLKATKCSQVIINCGSYGEVFSSIVVAARSIGIKTIDVQHGAIINHMAYSTSDIIADNENYYKYLPDELWTFGDYWSGQVAWKYRKIAVGNPHLLECQNKYVGIPIEYDYLIISQADEKSELTINEFVDELATKNPKSKICIRLHPAESKDVYIKLLEKYPNISFSTFAEINLYKDIERSKYIIGIYSTCLFEAVLFNRVPIIINSHEAQLRMPKNFGVRVSDLSNLDDLSMMNNVIDKDTLWYPDFYNKVSELLK